MGHPTGCESGQELHIVDEVEQPAREKQQWCLDGDPRDSHCSFSRTGSGPFHNLPIVAKIRLSLDLGISTPMGYHHPIALGRTPAMLQFSANYSILFSENEPLDRPKAAKRAGFEAGTDSGSGFAQMAHHTVAG